MFIFDFKIEQARYLISILNHKYDFRPELHHTQFSYHFITFIFIFNVNL